MGSVAIIGTGAVSAAGVETRAAFSHIATGKTALRSLTLFESGLKENPLCGQIPEEVEQQLDPTVPNRSCALALLALNEAKKDLPSLTDFRIGLFTATTVAGMNKSELFYKEYMADTSCAANASDIFANHEPAALTGWLAKQCDAAFFHSLSTACSTGLHALGLAKRSIERGMCDIAVAVGVDPLSILTLKGFASLMLIDPAGCRPFDKTRAGISIGEGAGVLILASETAVEKLNCTPRGYVSGWGSAADAYHMTAPHPEGNGAFAAASQALDEAGLAPDAIDMIAAHGTATPDNDPAEIAAMKRLFPTLPPFTSMKHVIGHTLAASGTLECVYALEAMNTNTIPASGGFTEYDEAVGAYPSSGEAKQIHHVMKNAFGFGGNNAVVILSKEKH